MDELSHAAAAVPLRELIGKLEELAPLDLAESWDNVGLLLGDRSASTDFVLTCLTLTPDVAAEAIERGAGLIVTHHSVLFRPIQKLTTDTSEGAMLLELAARRIAVYAPHTAFDSAAVGINQQWCDRLGIANAAPLRPLAAAESAASLRGSGRWGRLPAAITLAELCQQIRRGWNLPHMQFVGAVDRSIHTVGIACGAAAEYLAEADRLGCDVLITGEARFHACLEARARGIALILVGHYASERFACEQLARMLQQQFPSITACASEIESDPLQWL